MLDGPPHPPDGLPDVARLGSLGNPMAETGKEGAETAAPDSHNLGLSVVPATRQRACVRVSRLEARDERWILVTEAPHDVEVVLAPRDDAPVVGFGALDDALDEAVQVEHRQCRVGRTESRIEQRLPDASLKPAAHDPDEDGWPVLLAFEVDVEGSARLIG
jgi:hypothetical protein